MITGLGCFCRMILHWNFARFMLDDCFNLSTDTVTYFSPIHKLPNELLLQVFFACIPRVEHIKYYDANDPGHTLSIHSAPWCLSHVCRHWNLMLASYPDLWTTIILPMRPTPFQRHLALTQIRRSEDHPLSFYVPPWMSSNEPIFLALLQQRHRWKCVHVPYHSDPTTLKHSPFPLLEYIHCNGPAFMPNYSTGDLPRLRSALLVGFNDTQFRQLSLDPTLFSRLTDITLMESFYLSVHPLLHNIAHSLRSLNLVRIWEPIEASKITPFPQLRHLSLNHIPDSIFDVFDCPHLSELVILHCGQSKFFYSTLCKSGLHRTLTTLILSWFPYTDSLLNFLSMATSLMVLELRVTPLAEYCVDSDGVYIVERLFKLLSNKTVCPRLSRTTILCLKSPTRIMHQILAFVGFVESRAKTLRYATLSAAVDPPGPEVLHREKMLAYDAMVRRQLNDDVQRLRKEHPHLILRIEQWYYEAIDEMSEKEWNLGWWYSDVIENKKAKAHEQQGQSVRCVSLWTP